MKATQLSRELIRTAVAPVRLTHEFARPGLAGEGSEASGSAEVKTSTILRRRNQ